PGQTTVNLLSDPGFETGMAGWSTLGSVVGHARTTGKSHSGTYSMYGSLGQFDGYQYDAGNLPPGTYLFSAWVNSYNGGTALTFTGEVGSEQEFVSAT